MTLILPFMLGDERYGLKLTDIQEVIEGADRHYLPAAPAAIVAAVNVHGRILPVLDLPLFLGFPPVHWSERMIVLAQRDFPMVLAVDKLEPLLSVDLEQTTMTQSDAAHDCISGVLNWHGQMISLLDLEQLHKTVKETCFASGGDHAIARTDRR